MTRAQIITRLLTLPSALAAAESTLFRAQQEATRAKDALQDAEDRLLLRGALPAQPHERVQRPQVRRPAGRRVGAMRDTDYAPAHTAYAEQPRHYPGER